MRDLIVTENVTLDGVADGLEDWFTPYGADDIMAVNREHQGAADAVLLGRVTYEEFAGYWPLQTDDTPASPTTSTARRSSLSPRPSRRPTGRTPPSSGGRSRTRSRR